MKQSAYQSAGVDIHAGAELVDRIKPHVKKTNRSGVMAGLGGFGAFFDLKATGFKDPLLVSGTDGVGTKLKIAIESGIHDSIGIDLVAMCVNDIVVNGAEPLFFLDYYATGKLHPEVGEQIISGIAKGCEQAGCALVGGETAEMPGMYAADDYDLAGFTVGAVERDELITGDAIKEGSVVLGLASSGPHSNGYSLIRKIVKEQAGLDYDDAAPFADGQTLGQALITPTRIYVKAILKVIKALREQGTNIQGLAHITGGGFTENLPRVLPEGLSIKIDAASWDFPPVFKWLAEQGNVSAEDMAETFNCGIGMAVFCDAADVQDVMKLFKEAGEDIYEIGQVCSGEDQSVIMENAAQSWGI